MTKPTAPIHLDPSKLKQERPSDLVRPTAKRPETKTTFEGGVRPDQAPDLEKARPKDSGRMGA